MKISKNREKILDTTFKEFFKYGYNGMSIDSILKVSKTPKGSMYHFFPSKKDLLICTLKERIAPAVRSFFDFSKQQEENVEECINRIFHNMSIHEQLIMYGCPLHKLMVEMSANDNELNQMIVNEFKNFEDNLSKLFQSGIDNGEFIKFDTQKLARFFISSTWGEISISHSLSSKELFLEHCNYLIKLLLDYKKGY